MGPSPLPYGSGFWVLIPRGNVDASKSPPLTYGVIPVGFDQTVPSSGSPPPLQEGKIYAFLADQACRRKMRGIKERLIFSSLIALGAVLLTWVLHGESSPLADYFLLHDGFPNFWLTLNALPYILGAVISGSHAGSPLVLFTILQIIQWFIVAFVLSAIVIRWFSFKGR